MEHRKWKAGRHDRRQEQEARGLRDPSKCVLRLNYFVTEILSKLLYFFFRTYGGSYPSFVLLLWVFQNSYNVECFVCVAWLLNLIQFIGLLTRHWSKTMNYQIYMNQALIFLVVCGDKVENMDSNCPNNLSISKRIVKFDCCGCFFVSRRIVNLTFFFI